MAADNTLKDAASAATGGVKKTLSFIWDRVNPTKATGLLATAGFALLLYGTAGLMAPQAMAAVPTITAPTGASLTTKMTTMAANSTSHLWAATKVAVEGTGNFIAATDWSAIGQGVSNIGSAANSPAAGVPAATSGVPATLGPAIPNSGLAVPENIIP